MPHFIREMLYVWTNEIGTVAPLLTAALTQAALGWVGANMDRWISSTLPPSLTAR
jgi:hypothetical protein